MRVPAALVVMVLALAACSSGGDEPAERAPSTAGTTTSGPPPIVADAATCPVRDDAFCAVAADAANALAAGNADRLLELSRSDTINCLDVAREYFPGCQSQDVLDGYGRSGPDLLVELMTRDDFADELAAITGGVDPSYSDELGDGAVRVVGVGTCGPDQPDRRTYHLAWTAALREGGEQATRMLGSFEWAFIDDWRIVLTYLGPLEDWEATQSDPLDDAFCEAGRNRWDP